MRQRIVRRKAPLARFSDAVAPLLQRIYAARGLTCDADTDLNLSGLLAPGMLGMDAAVARLRRALEHDERILVVGDFDADGATSSALALRVLRAFGAAQVDFLVPNRFEFGYGLTPEIVAVAAERAPGLIVTVDNGIASVAGVSAAREHGIDVVVTDHHLPGAELPEAAAIVNPNQPGCPFPSKALAGVGVMFYLLSALRGALTERGWFAGRGVEPPRMADYLDLVALGTVADVVPLDRNNRILVAQGLRRLRAGLGSPGIYALLAVGRREPAFLQATDLGFVVGPRLNAAGRLDDMSIGIRCLLADNLEQARALAEQLDKLNHQRKSIEQDMREQALAGLRDIELDTVPKGIALFEEGWHSGVVGLVASKVKERYHRPVVAFAPEGGEKEGGETLKGSARSVPGVHIRDALDLLDKRHPGLILKFGGHAMAAGLSIPRSAFDEFAVALDRIIGEMASEEALTANLFSDGELPATELTLPTARLLQNAGPWGQHFPEPHFDGEFLLVNQRIVGEKHLKLVLAEESQPQHPIDAIAFNVDLSVWPNDNARRVHAYYRLDINRFRGNESLQLIVEALDAFDGGEG